MDRIYLGDRAGIGTRKVFFLRCFHHGRIGRDFTDFTFAAFEPSFDASSSSTMASPNAAILRLFDSMGTHFDYSGMHEVKRAVSAGVAPRFLLRNWLRGLSPKARREAPII